MLNPNSRIDPAMHRTKLIALIALGCAYLAVPMTVLSGLEEPRGEKSALDSRSGKSPAKAAAAPGGNQIRRWQYGRLIFEENHLDIPAESPAYTLIMHYTGPGHSPMYLVDAGSATCLIAWNGSAPEAIPHPGSTASIRSGQS